MIVLTTPEDLAAVVKTAVADALKDHPTAAAPELLTRAEAARYLNLSQDTVKRWARDGDLPERRYGNVIRYRRADLDALMAADNTPAR